MQDTFTTHERTTISTIASQRTLGQTNADLLDEHKEKLQANMGGGDFLETLVGSKPVLTLRREDDSAAVLAQRHVDEMTSAVGGD